MNSQKDRNAIMNPEPDESSPETAADRKLRLEAEKLAFEVDELKKSFWRRKEFIGFQGSVLVGLLGVLGTTVVTYYTSRDRMQDELKERLVLDTIAELGAEDRELRMEAGRRLARLDSSINLKELTKAFQKSLRDEKANTTQGHPPYLRVGAVEAVGAAGAQWRQSAEERAQFLRLVLTAETSPLVRYNAVIGLARLVPDQLQDIRLAYLSEQARVSPAVQAALRGNSEMLKVPSSLAVIGRDDGDGSEGPAHEQLVQAFWIDKRPVSFGQWNRVMKDNAETDMERAASGQRLADMRQFRLDPKNADLPVVGVGAERARDYCRNSGARDLPTEAQWEVAARGLSGWKYPWGIEPELALRQLQQEAPAWQAAKGRPIPLDTIAKLSRPQDKDVSLFGVVGLAMSVKHWTRSEWTADHRAMRKVAAPVECVKICVTKGGAGLDAQIYDTPERFAGARRQQRPRDEYDDNLGFRCVDSVK